MKFYDLTDNNLNYFLINGYKKIGFTTLSGKYIGLDRAKEAGNTLGAHIVLYRHDKIGTEYGTKVVGIQGPDKTYNINSKTNGRFGLYSYGSTSVIGNRGFAFGNYDSRTNGTYNSTTTTTVTQPGEFSYFVVPYSEELYLQKAVFLVKTRKK